VLWLSVAAERAVAVGSVVASVEDDSRRQPQEGMPRQAPRSNHGRNFRGLRRTEGAPMLGECSQLLGVIVMARRALWNLQDLRTFDKGRTR